MFRYLSRPVYPYAESPPFDDVMSYITGSSIQWGSGPQITLAELIETIYLFFRIACHSLWPISYLHTTPIERCVFLYALVFGTSISFPHMFLHSQWTDGPFIDEDFYGSNITSYKVELKEIGVILDDKEGCSLIASHLDVHVQFSTIVRI